MLTTKITLQDLEHALNVLWPQWLNERQRNYVGCQITENLLYEMRWDFENYLLKYAPHLKGNILDAYERECSWKATIDVVNDVDISLGLELKPVWKEER